MRSSLLALAGSYAMLVNAQDAAPAIETLTPFQKTQAACLAKCPTDFQDQNCREQCIRLHNPAGDEVLAIRACQTSCFETSFIASCLSGCLKSNGTNRGPFLGNWVVSSANFTSSAPASATATATPSVVVVSSTAISTSTGSSKTSSSVSATASSTASGIVTTSDAGDGVRIGMGGLGLFGLLVAFFM